MRKKTTDAEKINLPAKSTRHYVKKTGVSTRDVILQKACEIINNTGVVDFRIEALATALNLSPGNITYHFPKKEDIISAIWEQYIDNLADLTTQMITPLLDIKQLFLFHRTSAVRTLTFVGVVVYYYGDVGVLRRDNEYYNNQTALARKVIHTSYEILHKNGYMNEIEDQEMLELTFQSQFMMLRWWINHAMIEGDVNNIKNKIDEYITMSFFPLAPYLTDKGRRQFESILNVLQ